MRILFATGQGGGHVGPLIPFARAYERAGHEVLFRETAEVPKRVLMTLGHHVDRSELGALPPNVHVERWVPPVEHAVDVLSRSG